MKISIITATWNSEETILDCLKSVSGQTYKNKEHIIIDGCSSDNTLEMVNSCGMKVDFMLSENDKGIYDALNKGILKSKGDIIGFLHSDDMFTNSEVLSKIISIFEEKKVDAVYGDLEYVKKDNIEKIIRYWRAGECSKRKIQRGWMPPHPAFFMKKEAYLKYGLFDLSYRISADYDLLLKYIWKYKVSIVYIPEVLVKMRMGGVSNKNFAAILKKTCEDWRVMSSHDISPMFGIFCKNLVKLPQFFIRK